MDQRQETPLTEREVVRRGLLAGLAALGAGAAMKLTGAKTAHADHDTTTGYTPVGVMHIGVVNDGGDAANNNLNFTSLTSHTALVANRDVPVMTFRNNSTGSGAYVVNEISCGSAAASAAITGCNFPNDTKAAVFGTDGRESNDFKGVYGKSSEGTGVRGESVSRNGVFGLSSAGDPSVIQPPAAHGTVAGVVGQGVNRIGVRGISNERPGVQGESGTNYGVYGSSANGGIGVFGLTTTGAGMWGQSVSYIGVVGYATNAVGVYGFGGAAGMLAESNTGNGAIAFAKVANVAALHAENTVAGPGKLAARFVGDIVITGSYTATGTKSAVVPHPDGSMRTLYCTEATEGYFEDFGRAQLAGGVARVSLDPDFAPLVHATGYHVFAMAEGDSKGLFVTRQDATGFEVREQQGGSSNVAFSYRIVAKRRDVDSPRLKRVDAELTKLLKEQGPRGRADLARPSGPQTPSQSGAGANPPAGGNSPIGPRPPSTNGGPGFARFDEHRHGEG